MTTRERILIVEDDSAARIGLQQLIRGWGFDVEILYLARRRGYRVQQLAIDWYYDADSRVRGLSDSLSMLGEILRIRLYALLGFYRRRLPPTSDYRPSVDPMATDRGIRQRSW